MVISCAGASRESSHGCGRPTMSLGQGVGSADRADPLVLREVLQRYDPVLPVSDESEVCAAFSGATSRAFS